MVVAKIGVREHIVADTLAGAQPAAMADHQPRLRTQHREMVADRLGVRRTDADVDERDAAAIRSEEHTSELQSLMRISYAVFCLKKKKLPTRHAPHTHTA